MRAPFGSGALPDVMVSPLALRTKACASPPSAHSGVAATVASSSAVTRIDRPGIPAGRPGHADEIAATIAFVASDEASYLTGASLVVDGGMLLMAAEANQLA